jgi:hypothetical protein
MKYEKMTGIRVDLLGVWGKGYKHIVESQLYKNKKIEKGHITNEYFS